MPNGMRAQPLTTGRVHGRRLREEQKERDARRLDAERDRQRRALRARAQEERREHQRRSDGQVDAAPSRARMARGCSNAKSQLGSDAVCVDVHHESPA